MVTRKRGRPQADRAPFGTGASTMPPRWTVIAHLEAEWRAAGQWRHGSVRALAQHVNITREAVARARREPRYRLFVARLVQGLRGPPLADATGRRLEAAIHEAWERIHTRRE